MTYPHADLVVWLLDQIAEDERIARRAWVESPVDKSTIALVNWAVRREILNKCAEVLANTGQASAEASNLAERALRRLALQYAGRPGYRREWHP